MYLGQIVIFAGNYTPEGWAECNGALLPIEQNQALFAVIHDRYGGNCRTNFALPTLSPLNDDIKYYICIKGDFPPRS